MIRWSVIRRVGWEGSRVAERAPPELTRYSSRPSLQVFRVVRAHLHVVPVGPGSRPPLEPGDGPTICPVQDQVAGDGHPMGVHDVAGRMRGDPAEVAPVVVAEFDQGILR